MTNANQLYPEKLKIEKRIDWEMELIHEEHHYLAVWVKTTFLETNKTSYSLDVFEIENTKTTLLSEYDDKLAIFVKAAAQAFQRAKIQSEFSYSLLEIENKHLNIFDNFDSVVVSLFNRAQAGEFLGQQNDHFYLQDVASILGFSFPIIHTSVIKLEAQHRLGLDGNILIPWDERKANMDYGFASTGHKDYQISENGKKWWCRVCGSGGDFDELNPNDIPCV